MAQYGFASAPITRFSMRRAWGEAMGERMPTVRLSVPHWMLIGAAVWRARRRYELTYGANRAIAAGM